MSDQVQIRPSVLKAQVEEGWKLKPLAEHYGLPVTQMSKALKSLGLKIRKFHAPKFAFVDEATEESVEEFMETPTVTENVVELPTNAPIQTEATQEMTEENVEQADSTESSGEW